MTGICGHLPGTTCSNCAPRWASIAPWSSLPPDALGRIADALEKLVDAYAQAQRRDHYALTSDRYAANEARQREEAEPSPLDEDDHRDRIDGGGQRWCRMDGGCWHHEGKYPHDFGRCSWTLQQLQGAYGLLTFAPDAPQQTPSTATSADESTEAQEPTPEADGPKLNAQTGVEPLLCGDCGHLIDYHTRYVRCEIVRCPCILRASDIARTLIEQAVEQATGADRDVTLPEGWELVDGHDVRRVGWEPGWREGLVVRDHRRWYALSASTDNWMVRETKQAAVNWTIEQAGGGRG